jgi:hypothetical protein
MLGDPKAVQRASQKKAATATAAGNNRGQSMLTSTMAATTQISNCASRLDRCFTRSKGVDARFLLVKKGSLGVNPEEPEEWLD